MSLETPFNGAFDPFNGAFGLLFMVVGYMVLLEQKPSILVYMHHFKYRERHFEMVQIRTSISNI
jgi:hypothetical protein